MRIKHYDITASTLRDVIRERSSLGDKTFAIVDDESISYRDVCDSANRIGNSLLSLGVSKGDIVATYMHNSIDHISLWFGCAMIGAIWAPINIALINMDLEYTLKISAPKVFVVDEELLPNYLAIRDRIRRPDHGEFVRGDSPEGFQDFSLLKRGDSAEPVASVSWGDPAGLIYTGGSTGLPKGVLVSNGWYFPGFYRYKEMLEPGAADIHLGMGQMYHTIGSAVDIMAPFYWGLTTVLTRWFSASKFWKIVEKHKPSISVIIGPVIIALLSQPEKTEDSGNSLRLAGTGTGGIPREMIEAFQKRFQIDLLELYGQTETGPLGCVSQRLHDRPYHSLGTANGWAEIAVARLDGTLCPTNEVGEILLRPTYPGTFMLGYYGAPDKFAETCRDLWFHTGDLGHLDENGYLHFSGRVAHMIRRRGESVAAAEVEATLLLHPGIERCGVTGVPSSMGDEEIKACIQLREGAQVTPLEILEFCEDKIAYFKVPRYIEFVDALPLSATKGDVERYKLQETGISGAWDRESIGYKVRRRAL